MISTIPQKTDTDPWESLSCIGRMLTDAVPEYEISFADYKMKEILGLTEDKITEDGRAICFSDFIYKYDEELYLAQTDFHKKKTDEYIVRLRINDCDGHLKWIEMNSKSITDKDGSIHIASACRDITSEICASRFFSELHNNFPGGLIHCVGDKTLTVDYINPSFLKLLGFSFNEIKTVFHSSLKEMIYIKDRDIIIDKNSIYTSESDTNIFTLRFIRKYNEPLWTKALFHRVKELGTKNFFYVTLQDITDVKALEATIEEIRNK